MLNPFTIPGAILRDIAALSAAVQRLPEIERLVATRLTTMQATLDELPLRLEVMLHESFRTELQSVRRFPDHFDEIERQLTEMREVVENLRGPSERLARIDDKLPGD